MRSKILNTMGPDSLTPVLRKIDSTPLGPDSTAKGYGIVPAGIHRVVPVTATAISTYLTNVPAYAYDTNPTTYWSQGAYPPGWIYFEFTSAFIWRQISVLHNLYNDGRPGAFQIEGSNNASSWTLIGNYGQKPANQLWTRINIFDSTPYRYIRINATTSGGEWWAVNDVDFWAAGPSGAVAPGDTYGSTVFADSPIGYWRLDETSGTAPADVMKNYTAMVTDGTVVLGEPGKVDKSYRFTNISGYVVIGGTSILHGPSPSAFSAECWFKISTQTQTSSGQPTYQLFGADCYVDAFSNNSWSISMHTKAADATTGATGPGQIVASVAYGSTRKFVAYNTRLDDAAWHHVVLTFDGIVRLYTDGALRGSSSGVIGDANPGTKDTVIGLNPYFNGSNPARYFPGNIDEVAFYRSVLTPAQITAHYNAAWAS